MSKYVIFLSSFLFHSSHNYFFQFCATNEVQHHTNVFKKRLFGGVQHYLHLHDLCEGRVMTQLVSHDKNVRHGFNEKD